MSNIKKYGIDISEHQGDFDLSSYKDQFVIIRAAWGTNEDKQFRNNVSKCNSLGIPFGVYLYSYALSIEDAKAEANYLINLIKGLNISCGVWFDMEDADHYKQKKGALNADLISNMCRAFCSIVEEAGYYTGVYASQSWFGTYIKNCDAYDKWVANWGSNSGNKETDTSHMGTIQQYTSKPLDKNVMFVDVSTYNINDSDTVPKPQPQPTPSQSTGSIVVGSIVRPKTNVSYDGVQLASFVCSNEYPVIELKGNRAVLGNGLNTAFNTANLTLISGGGSAPQPTSIKVGSTVVVTNPVDVNGTRLGVSGTYSVIEINGSRVVIGRGGIVTAAININNLKLV